MKNRLENLDIIFAPVIVMAFVGLLAVMYGWVGTFDSPRGHGTDAPETLLVAGVPVVPDGVVTIPSGVGKSGIRLMNSPAISSGIGNSGIRLANRFPASSAYLGANLSTVDAQTALSMGLPRDTGLLVVDVIHTSPAEKAGLFPKDIILRLDQRMVNSLEQIAGIISLKNPGDVVKMRMIDRFGRKRSLHARLADGPTGTHLAAGAATPWIGADIQNIDAVMKTQLSLSDRSGVIISKISRKGPAEKAGLRRGDVIRSLDGTVVRNVKKMRELIAGASPGKELALVLLREGENRSTRILPGRAPASGTKKMPALVPAEVAVEGSWIGMDLGELSPNDAADLNLPEGTRGVMVNDVESPPASMVGFQTGDIITAVNGMKTPDMKVFVRATRNQRGAVTSVIRGDRLLYITVPPPGYTQNGTKINNGTRNRFAKVAFNTPAEGNVGVITSGSGFDAPVSGDISQNSRRLLLLNPSDNTYADVSLAAASPLERALDEYNVTALIGGSVSRRTIAAVKNMGISFYGGVSGSAGDVYTLYRQGKLEASR